MCLGSASPYLRGGRGVDEREIHGGNGYAYTYVVGEQE